MASTSSDVRRALVVLACGALSGCNLFKVPGLGRLAVPSAAHVEPEPLMCGETGDPEPVPSDPDGPIVGAADLHNHQFSNLGFGERLLHGASWDPDGIEQALSSCGAEELCVDDREMIACQEVICRLDSDPAACRKSCERYRCETSPPHGHLGLTDPVGAALGQGHGHQVSGYPRFHGWPHHNSYTHQQEYHRWLRRAFDGGLKLMVMLAVSNEVLCKFLGGNGPCDDMTNVDRQIAAAKDLERFIDWQTDCDDGNDNGWYQIARSPARAREIIASGRMAVVLGVEVDTLFNCYKNGSCARHDVEEAIATYRRKGVRHFFLVHVFDNAFGGAAAYGDFFNFGNVVVNGDLLHVRDCSPEYEFRFDRASSEVNGVISTIAQRLGVDYGDYEDHPAHCNRLGLSDLGAEATDALMNAGMIIDVDHMSALTRKKVLAIAEKRGYPGVMSGHSGFTRLYRGDKKSEGQLTEAEVSSILDRGGLLAPILHQGTRDEMDTTAVRSTIVHDCGNSSKSFTQAYLYAVQQVKKKRTGEDVAVGFGSDVNGLAGMPVPRFGPYACAGDGVPQDESTRVTYPFEPLHGSVASMDRMQAGTRIFDINVDGFANMGMFPDFIAELQRIGLKPDELRPLFNSAEAYIRTWQRVESWRKSRKKQAEKPE